VQRRQGVVQKLARLFGQDRQIRGRDGALEGLLADVGEAWPLAVCVLGFLREVAPHIRYFVVLINMHTSN
jgi:hypothetical protein